MTMVVDASVALKWYVREEDSERALALLDSAERFHAPLVTTDSKLIAKAKGTPFAERTLDLIDFGGRGGAQP